MRIMLHAYVLLVLFQLFVFDLCAQSLQFKSGFDKNEFIELLKVSSRQSDSLYNPNFPEPQYFDKVYRSNVMGLANRWDLWLSDESTAVISIR